MPVARWLLLGLQNRCQFGHSSTNGQFFAHATQPEFDKLAISGHSRLSLEPGLATLEVNAAELLVGFRQIDDAFDEADDRHNHGGNGA